MKAKQEEVPEYLTREERERERKRGRQGGTREEKKRVYQEISGVEQWQDRPARAPGGRGGTLNTKRRAAGVICHQSHHTRELPAAICRRWFGDSCLSDRKRASRFDVMTTSQTRSIDAFCGHSPGLSLWLPFRLMLFWSHLHNRRSNTNSRIASGTVLRGALGPSRGVLYSHSCTARYAVLPAYDAHGSCPLLNRVLGGSRLHACKGLPDRFPSMCIVRRHF